jgi:MSHA pilin protein MshC
VPSAALPFRKGRLAAPSNGFTMTELVIVIVLLAIVSVYAASRLNRSTFETRAVYDQLAAQLAHARRTAIAQRRPVCVHLTAAQSVLFYGDATPACPGGNGVPSPSGTTPFTVGAGSTVFSAAPALPQVLRFDAAGRYLTATGGVPLSSLVLTVTGDGALQLTVERESGYVHP